MVSTWDVVDATCAADDSDEAMFDAAPAGLGLDTAYHGATLQRGAPGVLHGSYTMTIQDPDGQIHESHSISAGLDYPGVGPEHAHLQDIGRASYLGCRDDQAVHAYRELARTEGILPALESAHALSQALEMARDGGFQHLLVNLSGRGDKDLATGERWIGEHA